MEKSPEILILEEHPDWVVCIKPAGIDSEHEMPDLLKERLGSLPYPVHRLDRNVSGIMVYARSSGAAAGFSRLAMSGQLCKEYVLLCHGSLPEQEGRMEDLLWKDSRKNKVFVVDRMRAGVRSAALSYRVISAVEPDKTLVRVQLETGRSHQIRVQFASRRCPLWGDHRYGARDDEKDPLLFSCGLSFPWQDKIRRFSFLPAWAGPETSTVKGVSRAF